MSQGQTAWTQPSHGQLTKPTKYHQVQQPQFRRPKKIALIPLIIFMNCELYPCDLSNPFQPEAEGPPWLLKIL